MKTRANINSAEVWRSPGYPMNQPVAEPDGRRVHLTGQVAWDADFNILHVGDAAAQTKARFRESSRQSFDFVEAELARQYPVFGALSIEAVAGN